MPPNEPATPGTGLFETGCVLCGSADPPHYRIDGPFKGSKYCKCAYGFPGEGGVCGVDIEIAKRKSAPSPAFVPAVGEMCEGLSHAGVLTVGAFARMNVARQPVVRRSDGCRGDFNDLGLCALRPETLRPVTPAPVYFGTMPKDDELPLVLDGGIRDGHGDNQTHDLVRLERTEAGTPRYVCEEGGGCCWSPPDRLPWHRIPRPSQKAVPAPVCAECGATLERYATNWHNGTRPGTFCSKKCADGPNPAPQPEPGYPEPGQSPPDPYAGYDLNAWGIRREPDVATSSLASMTDLDETWGRPPIELDSRIASARHAPEREAGVKHPSDWDVDDTEELTVS